MAEEITDELIILAIVGVVLLALYLYMATIEKVLERIGFSKQEAGTILFVTLFLGWITIPLFPYDGWWVGISLGGALIPLIICGSMLRSRRVGTPEGFIGVIIVAVITYFVTRPVEGVGIVADLEFAFAPALAAGLYSMSTFWADIRKAAPLGYFSGVVGTLVGADVFHLAEILSYQAPAEGFPMLSIGGANVFDMVYLTGIVAVIVAMIVYWMEAQKKKLGFERVVAEFEAQAEGLSYARDIEPAPKMVPDRRGKLRDATQRRYQRHEPGRGRP